MTSPPAERPRSSRAGGRGLEVYDGGGNFLRRVTVEAAARLVAEGLGIAEGERVKLRAGIRWISPRDENQAAGRPDLEQLARREPGRFAANWRGSSDPHIGKGALGRSGVDRTVFARH
jgi:hypothetical protein